MVRSRILRWRKIILILPHRESYDGATANSNRVVEIASDKRPIQNVRRQSSPKVNWSRSLESLNGRVSLSDLSYRTSGRMVRPAIGLGMVGLIFTPAVMAP